MFRLWSREPFALRQTLALACALFCLAACGEDRLHGADVAEFAEGAPIVFGISWEPVSFNPLRALDSGSYYAQTLVYEGLIKYDVDLSLVAGLAKSFSISSDGKTYSFLLRRGLKFSDGTPLTIDDVLASIKMASSDLSPFKGDYKCIEQIKPDYAENSLVLSLAKPSAPLLARLAELRILPAKLLNAADHGASKLNRCPVASGPFCLKKWEAGMELVFEPNPFYWGRKPAYRQLVWRVVPDKTLLDIALRRGEVDVAAVDPLSSSAAISRLQNIGSSSLNKMNLVVRGKQGPVVEKTAVEEAAVEKTQIENIKIEKIAGTRTIYLGFNLDRNPFNNRLVRQAIDNAINKDELTKILFGGFANVPTSDVSKGAWYFNSAVSPQHFDQNKAKTELLKAGFSLKGGKWYQNSSNTQLAFRILTIKDLQDVAQVASNYLAQIGIETEVQVMEYTTLRAKHLRKRDFDVFLWSRSAGTDPDCALVWGSGAPLNFVDFSNKEVDRLISDGRLTGDRSKRILIYQKIQAILVDEEPWVLLARPDLLIAHKKEIINTKQANQEMTGLPWDNPLFNAPRWERRSLE